MEKSDSRIIMVYLLVILEGGWVYRTRQGGLFVITYSPRNGNSYIDPC